MRERELNTMQVNFADVQLHDPALAESIAEEFYRFEPYLRRAVQDLVRDLEPDYTTDEGETREFYIAFYNTGSVRKVRDLHMPDIGRLSSFCGTITRTTEVRPELLYGRFVCGECSMLSPPVEQQFKLTEPSSCQHFLTSGQRCENTKSWKLDISRSRFGDWQRVRVQENADEIPPGACARACVALCACARHASQPAVLV